MACNTPLHAWRAKDRNAAGNIPVTFRFQEADTYEPVKLPCGKCYGCLLDKARGWAIRCYHESKLWEMNSFVTLTYDEKRLPLLDGVPTLRPRDFTIFMKKLRRWKKKKSVDGRIRYFQCGEYGVLGRPHHHALLFNCHFDDRVVHSRSARSVLYRSEELEEIWPYGFSSIGDVSIESAGYVAQYTLKKVESKHSDFEVNQLGQIRRKTYCTMSRRPGIGADWISKHHRDVYPSDQCLLPTGVVVRPPRYYDNTLTKEELGKLNKQRQENLTDEFKYGDRQYAREKILKARQKLRERRL